MTEKNEWNWPHQIVKFIRNSFHLFVVCLCFHRFGFSCWILFDFIVLSRLVIVTRYKTHAPICYAVENDFDSKTFLQLVKLWRQMNRLSNIIHPMFAHNNIKFSSIFQTNVTLNCRTEFHYDFFLLLVVVEIAWIDLILMSLLFIWLAMCILDINWDKWTSARFKWEYIIVCAIAGSFKAFESIFIVRFSFFYFAVNRIIDCIKWQKKGWKSTKTIITED